MMPETIPIRLMITWTIVKVAKLIPRTMVHSPLLDQGQMLLVSPANCHIGGKLRRHAGGLQNPAGAMPESFARLS
jgi:hypothetical protein